ncbi:o-succinylbenzoate synthase [Candidatus Nanohalobium constans]|uniref:o-succinylbenzoate synthase n=1 Tax=Candidatus Nanohalobium constans TaxID=2565781 RepID=A0A5Q0UFK0_9ARCH|nr:o-succinylbenzoate synthase [Candidatus Nanohalobium constans]QGA80368.1 O-succinylbenzoate synthase [Candidatus Nanohalobium constans]
MDFEKLELRKAGLDLVNPFETSNWRIETREVLILCGKKNGEWVYGETSVLPDPVYNHESTQTAQEFIKKYVIPAVKDSNSVEDYWNNISYLKGHPHAKSSGDQLLHHRQSVNQEKSLKDIINGAGDVAECGVSLGVTDEDKIVEKVQGYLDQGYKRIKLKIKPGKDIGYVRKVRKHFPDVDLMADANSAYSLSHKDRLKKLDSFDLQMIEQPLSHDDLVNHSVLNNYIDTPICLDESIHSAEDVKRASRIDACSIVNLKPQRVGGIKESVKINQACKEEDMKMWMGGVIESGIGASTQIILSSLSEIKFPGDIGASSRYFEEDIVNPEIKVNNGQIKIPDNPGLTNSVDRGKLKEKTMEKWTF